MTDDAFLIVDETAMPNELDQAIRDLLCACFPADIASFSKTRHWHGSAPTFSVVHRLNEKVDGNIAIVIRDVRVGSETVRIAGVQNMAVRPGTRGGSIGSGLMDRAMTEARTRGVQFGLLFCTPDLERYYRRYGWKRNDVTVKMDYNGEADIPIPGKNICMTLSFTGSAFPAGGIHVGGADW